MLPAVLRMTVAFVLAISIVAPVAAADDRPVVSGETGRRLDEYLGRLERLGFAGGALAVRGKEVLLLKAYGLADRERNIPLTTDSVFSLGSITKQFTAAAILTLEMQGKLSVTDPISKYLDKVPADKSGITLHHLLTHSSGLESDFSPTDYEPVGREEYVRRALGSKLLFTPGDGYEYSNAGYSLLAAIVEKISGQSYEAYLTERVLKPAGMRETGYKMPAWAASRLAHGYRDGQDWGTILQRIQAPDAPYWMLRGNGGLHTTLSDMLAWHRSLDSDAVLSKDERAKYFKPYVAEGPQRRSFYAYGWAVGKTSRGTSIVQHNGGNGIYVAEVLRFPDEDAMLFLTSTDAGMKATPVVQVLEQILFGGKYEMPPLLADVAPARLAALAGRWQLPKGALTLVADNKALLLQPDSPEAFAALAPSTGAQAERFAALTARTADISARAFKGDVSGVHEAMGGGMPIDAVREQEAGTMRDRESRLGPFKGSAVLGTLPREGDTAQTIVRLDFEKASVYNVYVWGPRRLLGIRGMPQLPGFRFVPVSDGEFVSFSLDGGIGELRLQFETKDGESVLLLRGPTSSVVARRAPRIMAMHDRDVLFNRWLKTRFEQVLPEIMRREQIDMWIVICREHNEDPVYTTLVPHPSMFAWRLTMFVYFDRGAAGVERLTVNRYGGGDLHKDFPDYYQAAWEPETLDSWQRLAQIVRARNPKRIAVNESETWAFADGLSAANKTLLVRALGPQYAGRLVSAERLVVGWLERRSLAEIEFYPQIVAVNHQVVAEAFSNHVITPGVTTIDDLEWWVRDRLAQLTLDTWFPPMFYIIRSAGAGPPTRVIQRGDLLRCDVGVTYIGLNSDIQEVAYVLRDGETGAPTGLKNALATGNRLQDILLAEMKTGRAGNAILASALAQAKAEGLAPKIYSHPIGYHGHAAGTRIGLPDMQDGVPGMGDYPLFADTCWAIELSVQAAIPEWGNQQISMALEQDAVFTATGASFLDGRQTTIHLIR